jgi:hypothetical protein
VENGGEMWRSVWRMVVIRGEVNTGDKRAHVKNHVLVSFMKISFKTKVIEMEALLFIHGS